MPTLHSYTLGQAPKIVVVGTGGTGGFVAEGLCRLLTGTEAHVMLIDHDRVERHNLLRQAFYPNDVGKFKAQVLAERLARQYQRPIGYSIYPFSDESFKSQLFPGAYEPPNLLIGCVDNAAARRAMSESPKGPMCWWVDAGNDKDWGQVLVGNGEYAHLSDSGPSKGQWLMLPGPVVQMPSLLTATPSAPPDIDCAAALDLVDQDPTINGMVASLVLQVVRRLLAGTCPWMALYLDMAQGTVNPVYATMDAVERICEVANTRN